MLKTILLTGLILFMMHHASVSQGSSAGNNLPSKTDTAFLRSLIEMPYDKVVSNLVAADTLAEIALEIAKKQNDPGWLAHVYTRMALVNYLRGNYNESVDYNQKAIRRFLEAGDTINAGHAFCDLGYQMKRRNLPQAFEYMRKGINLLDKYPSADMSASYDNFGVLHEMAGKLDSALYFYNKALDIKYNNNDSIGIPFSLNNIAQTLMLKGDYKRAKDYLDEAFEIRMKRNDTYGIIENQGYHGDLHSNLKNYEQAIRHYKKALNMARENSYLYMWHYAAGKISDCYENLGDYYKALQYFKQYQQIGDSLLNLETTKQIAELEVEFETLEKEKELQEKARQMDILSREKAEAELELLRRNRMIYAILSVTLIAVLLFMLFFQRYRQRQRNRLNQAIIAEKERNIRAVISAEENERNRIARELHDGIGQQMSALKLSWQALVNKYFRSDDRVREEIGQITKTLDESAGEVRSISHQMMPKGLKEAGLEPAVNDMLKSVFRNSPVNFNFDAIGVDGEINEDIRITVFRVLQELINNIIKYASATQVDIQLLKRNDLLVLMVEDNGAGFDVNEKSSGIGLTNIRSRVGNVKGEFKIESEPGKGTRSIVRIPV